MPFVRRLAIFLGLWLLAGATCGIFAKVPIQAGDSEFMVRLQVACLAPFLSVIGIVFTVIPEDFSPWKQRDHDRLIAFWVVFAFMLAHSIFTLARRDRQQFLALVAVEAVFLVASVSCILSMYEYFDTHGW